MTSLYSLRESMIKSLKKLNLGGARDPRLKVLQGK